MWGFTRCHNYASVNCLSFPGRKPRDRWAAQVAPFRPQVFWCEDCWNFVSSLSLRSLNHLFLDLDQPVSLLASSSLEGFSLVSENKEAQMAAGAQDGSTGAAFSVNFASRLHHIKLVLPRACTCTGNISIYRFHLLFIDQPREISSQLPSLLKALGIIAFLPYHPTIWKCIP